MNAFSFFKDVLNLLRLDFTELSNWISPILIMKPPISSLSIILEILILFFVIFLIIGFKLFSILLDILSADIK